MKVVCSSVFCTMSFPHNGKIVTIDQLTYIDPNSNQIIDKRIDSLGGKHAFHFQNKPWPCYQ